jgi:enoyl-CoA hydratase/carnithine racemase
VDDAGWGSLGEAFRALSERRDVTAVVVRGSLQGRGPDPSTGAPGLDEALAALRGCRHPTIAVIEGLCVGVDLEIAACCDLRVCGESSRLGAPLERRTEGGEAEAPLAHLLGASPVLGALQGGDMLDAERARAFGLVSHVHPDTAVVEHAYRLAASVAAGAPLVNRWHKRMVQRLQERPGDRVGTA